jgi:hypothetical protein
MRILIEIGRKLFVLALTTMPALAAGSHLAGRTGGHGHGGGSVGFAVFCLVAAIVVPPIWIVVKAFIDKADREAREYEQARDERLAHWREHGRAPD